MRRIAQSFAALGVFVALFGPAYAIGSRIHHPPPPPPPPPKTGTLLFSDNFTAGLGKWFPQSCVASDPAPVGNTIVTSPERAPGEPSVRFTVADNSTHANCPAVPTSDARAQLVGPGMFVNGSHAFIAWSEMFPTAMRPPSWFGFAEVYGAPNGGSPSMFFGVTSDDRMAFSRDATHNYDTPWESAPYTPGAWYDITIEVNFSTSSTVGFVRLWLDGVPQTFTNGSTTLSYDTLVTGVNWDGMGTDALFLNQYRSAAASASMGTVSIYASQVKIGTTYAIVQPPSQ